MPFVIVFGTTWVYQLLTGTLLAQVVDTSMLPRVALLWVCVLADRTPSTAARETDVWLSGLFASCILGYMLDLSLVAPRGMHLSIYAVVFIVVRLLLSRLGQSRRLAQLVLLTGVTLGTDVLTWWVKGLSLGFVNFSQFDGVFYVVRALSTGVAGALFFGAMSGIFAERGDGSLRRL
jgi:hypothetical protein